MRGNLDDNLARRVRHSSPLFSTVQNLLTGSLRITKEGPTFFFLDAGGASRDVFLPPIEPGGGQFIVIVNIGSSGQLLIRDFGGALLKTLDPNQEARISSSRLQWFFSTSYTTANVVITSGSPVAGQWAQFTSPNTITGATLPIREKLTANRVYFVRPDGSDSNNGLSNTAGGAFLTIQKAIDTAVALDPGTFAVGISVAASGATPYGQFSLKSYIGSGSMIITGDIATPTNCVVQSTSGSCVIAAGVRGAWTVQGFHLKGTGAAGSHGLLASGGSIVTMSNVRFETPAAFHVSAATMSNINLSTGISVAGNFNIHIYAETQAYVREAGITVTIIGTPVIAQAWCFALQGSTVITNGNTYSGGPATGPRSSTSSLSYVFTGGTGAGGTYFPGNGGNTVATGGVID